MSLAGRSIERAPTRSAARLPRVLIGPVYTGFAESVSMVNRTFVDGLQERVTLTPHNVSRQFGTSGMGRVNVINLAYSAQHSFQWLYRLLRFRPAIAHYAVGAGPNLEKGFLHLKLAALLGIPTIAHIHSGAFVEFWRGIPELRRAAARRAFARLDALVVLSHGWKKAILSEVSIDPNRVFVVNNPIEPEFENAVLDFHRCDVWRSRGTSAPLLALGIMEKSKGVIDLIDAVAAVPRHIKCNVIIAGPEREPGIRAQVERRISDLAVDDRITLLGEVRGEQKVALFRQAGGFLLPSYFENFPLVVLEAAAAGLPVITTPVGATPEFFEEGRSALFVEPGDISSLSQAMQLILTDPCKRCDLGLAARSTFVSRLSRNHIMDAMYNVYNTVLQTRQAKHKNH